MLLYHSRHALLPFFPFFYLFSWKFRVNKTAKERFCFQTEEKEEGWGKGRINNDYGEREGGRQGDSPIGASGKEKWMKRSIIGLASSISASSLLLLQGK